MPISLDPQMMREIIMDHYSDPDNKKVPEDLSGYLKIRMDSDSCIDDITIYLKSENGKIVDASFDGIGCTISTASTDILCNLIKGKSVKDALYILKQYDNMIFEKPYDETVLDEAIVFKNTHKQAARIKCAMIGCRGLEDLMEGKEKNNG
jgi:nitrogen fixation NifU-like protein